MSVTEHHCHFRLDSIVFLYSLEVMIFQGVEAISKPFSFDIEAVSLYGEIDLQHCLFADAYLSSKLPGVGFHGQIHSIGRSNTGPGPAQYHITLGPRMGCLGFRYNQRVFQDMPGKSIIRKVLREHGIHEDGYVFELIEEQGEREFCAQHGDSDLQLIERICAQEGIHYYFEHSPDNHVLVFTDNLRETPRTSSVHFNSQFQRGEITRFAICQSVTSESGKRLPTRVRGTSGLHFLRAGMQLPMTGHDDPFCNQPWLLTEVTHHGVQPVFTVGKVEPAYVNGFTCVPSVIGLRSKASGAVRQPVGIQRARIVGALFDEALRDPEGRIRVCFDWGHQGDGSRYNDCWLPLATELQARDLQWWGGMEVVVSFRDGDPDRPMISDTLYDPDVSPARESSIQAERPTEKPVEKHQAAITTRLDRKHFLGDTQQIHLDDLTLHLDSSNEVNFSVGGSHLKIDADGVTLSGPNIVLSTLPPPDDAESNTPPEDRKET
jgi:type VI secretion system secreted protein VgrG